MKDRIYLHASVLAAWVVGTLHVFNFTGSLTNFVFAGLIGDGIDWVTDQIPWPPFDMFGILRNAFDWLLNVVVTGMLDTLGFFFLVGVEEFLFYENPRTIDALNEYWIDSLVLYVFIVFAMTFAYYVMLMLLADTEEAEVQRIVHRLILSAIFLVISRELFGFFVAFTNDIAFRILPADYSFYVAVEMMEGLTAVAGSTMVAFVLAVFGGMGVLVTGVLFFIVLAMRMVLIYVIYAIMPVILGLWVVDVGPGKYGKFFADFLIKIGAVLMIAGILIAGILAVGASFGVAGDGSAIDLASDYDGGPSETTVLSTDPDGPRSQVNMDEGRGGELAGESSSVVFRIFMFLGTSWLIIAVMVSMGGMVLSAGSGSAGGAGGFSGSGSGSAAGAGAQGSGGQPGPGVEKDGNTWGSQQVYETEDGSHVVTNPAGGGVLVNPDAGLHEQDLQTFGPENNPLADETAEPNPFNTVEPETPPSLSDKASHVGGMMKNGLESMPRGEHVTGTGSDVKNRVQAAYDKIPGPAKKMGSLAKRGGKAYGSVFMTDGAMASVGEMGRIARESPIGHPNKPGEAGQEPGPVAEEEVTMDAFDMDTVTEAHRSAEGYASLDTGGDSGSTGVSASEQTVNTGVSEPMSEGTGSEPPDEWLAGREPDGQATAGSNAGIDTSSVTSDSTDTGSQSTDDVVEETTSGRVDESKFKFEQDTVEPDTIDEESVAEDSVSEDGMEQATAESKTIEADTELRSGSETTREPITADGLESAEEAVNDLKTYGESDVKGDYPYPHYYASGLEQSLEAADSIEEQADALEAAGVDPDEMADALASEAETVAKRAKRSMGRKGAKDHHEATEGFDDVQVEWDGSVSEDSVVDLAQKRSDVREAKFEADLTEYKNEAMDTASAGRPGRSVIKDLEEEYKQRDFETEEEEIAFMHHAGTTAEAVGGAASEEKLKEYNERDVF